MAKYYDTLLGEYIKNPWVRWLSLDKLANREFWYQMISYDEITNKKKLNFIDIDLNNAWVYSWEDVYITNKIFKKHKEYKIINNKILNDIEIPLIDVIKKMEIDWVFVDRDRLKWIWILLDEEIKNTKKQIIDEVGEEFNISSPKQVWEILFEKLGLPKWKKTKTWYSVWAEVLWNLAQEYKIAQKILDFRHYSKIKSTYIEWLLDLIDENDLVHTSYNSFITATWRLSSTSPNLQNIPVSSWIAWEVRDAFISRFEKWKILTFDYSQVEVRLLAIMSDDNNLIEAFKSWEDIHHKTAGYIFWKQKITNSERKIAKAVNFWVIYWISPFWLAKMINISQKDSKLYIDKFYESYPKVRIFLDEIIKKAEKNWFVETLFWRKRYINWINDQNKLIKKSAEREAINMPIQWTSADIIKIAMIKIFDFFKTNKLKSKMIMQVHDELVFDTYPWEEEILKNNITNIMENILENTKIKLKIDIWEENSWKYAK